MKQFKYNKFLILLIVIGMLASLVIDVERHQVEQQNRSVELVMDYEDLVELAEKEGDAAEFDEYPFTGKGSRYYFAGCL